MKVIASLRATEWWEHKLPPLLTLGYATALITGSDILEALPNIIIAVVGFILSASFVSVLNDLTDAGDDKMAGKGNRLFSVSVSGRIVLFTFLLLLCMAFLYWIRDSIYSVIFMSMALCSYILYSTPPIRLKKRGVAGLLADAAGAHLFSGLFFVSMVFYAFDHPLSFTWFSVVGVWSLTYGLRGILWHQLSDRDHDAKAGLKTAARALSHNQIRSLEMLITGFEWVTLALILLYVHSIFPLLALVFCLLMLYSYHQRGIKLILAQPLADRWHIIMSDFYQVYLPLSLILAGSVINPYTSLLLIVHVLLFPIRIKAILKDLYGMLILNRGKIISP